SRPHRSPDNPDPHSFPTRRPSDLPYNINATHASTAYNHVCCIHSTDPPSSVVLLGVFQCRGLPMPASSDFLRPASVEVSFLRSLDRKSTRLNSSHVKISYAVFCLK